MKNVLITGCSSGFGLVTAQTLANSGFNVYASVKNINTATRLTELNIPNLKVIQINVTNEQSIKDGVVKIFKEVNQIDILINNAGIGYIGFVDDFSIEEIQTQFDLNFFGYLRMIKAVLPKMKQNKSGLIINITSINGLITFPMYGVYSASKFALEAISEALKLEMLPNNIKVVLVEPGTFMTRFSENKQSPKKLKQANQESDIDFNKKYNSYLHIVEKLFGKNIFNPQRVADLILRIVNTENPKTRYLIGFDSRVFLFLKKILPETIKIKMLRKVYGW